jgi:imidazolonepropionase-like amidohydrolase
MADVIFSRANLLDGTNPSRPDSTVVVRDNRIARVTTGSIEPGPGDRLIDLAGRTLMPGMVVGHMHIDSGYAKPHNYMDIYARAERPPGVLMARSMHNCKALVASGVTSYVGAGCSNDIDPQLRMIFEDGLLDGPRIIPGSRFINSTGHDAAMAKWWYDMNYHPHDVFADGADEFRNVTRTEIFHGAEIVKIIVTSGHGGTGRGRGLTHDEIAAVVEAAHDRGKRVRAHCVWRDVIVECLELGVDVIDHGDEIDERCIELMVERGTTWIPSLWFQRVLRNLPPGGPSLPTEDADRNWENVIRMLPVANDAGVRIVPGDDYAPIRPGVYGEELSIYVNDVGVKPLDVLRWATHNGAQLTGEATGAVTEGLLADLVVVDRDPSLDITVLEDVGLIKAVMIDGRFVKYELDQAVVT